MLGLRWLFPIILALVIDDFPTPVGAQNVPAVIPYQGKIADQSGSGVDITKPLTIVFRIYSTPVGGVPVWQEVQDKIVVQGGYFSVLLGSINPFPNREMFDNTVYLGITIDDGKPETADIELRPRQAITPVITAVHAREAEDAKHATAAGHAEQADLAARATVADSVPSIVGEVPVGGILPYWGDPAKLPANWRVCNHDTLQEARSPFDKMALPDLRGMFVRGVDPNNALGGSGGQDSVPDHSHWIGINAPVYIPTASINGFATAYNPVTRAEAFDMNLRNLTAPDNAPAGAESHGHINGVANVQGPTIAAGGHDNRPRFTSLYYIIRIY